MNAGAQQMVGQDLAAQGVAAGEQVPASFAETAGRTATPSQIAAVQANTPGYELASKGFSSLGQTGGLANFGNAMTATGGPGLGRVGLAAASPMLVEDQAPPPAPVVDNKMPQRLRYEAGVASPLPAADVPGYGNLGQDFGSMQNYYPGARFAQITPDEAKQIRGYAGGGMMASGGGPVELMSDQAAIGANTGYPMANVSTSAFATPYQDPRATSLMPSSGDSPVSSMTGELKAQGSRFAAGGYAGGGLFGDTLANLIKQMNGSVGGESGMPQGYTYDPATQQYTKLATGGIADAHYNLGGYSDGGRLLRGPGDGVSDSIPAMIGKKQPARLADGEFVVPARIVSELGNGSTEAGARRLYAMMDRVQKARGKTVGKGKVAVNSKADRLLPA
jgi:hypothetical protein